MNSEPELIVQCPTCKKPVLWGNEQRYKPFCSRRCKLIDLGDWATETHKIPGNSVMVDVDPNDIEVDY